MLDPATPTALRRFTTGPCQAITSATTPKRDGVSATDGARVARVPAAACMDGAAWVSFDPDRSLHAYHRIASEPMGDFDCCSTHVAAERVAAFLEFWEQDDQKNHIIYGLGRRDEMRELSTRDLRTLIAAAGQAPHNMTPDRTSE